MTIFQNGSHRSGEASLTVRMNLAATRTVKKDAIELVPSFRLGRSDVSELSIAGGQFFFSFFSAVPGKCPPFSSKRIDRGKSLRFFPYLRAPSVEVGKEERLQSLTFLTGTDRFVSLSLSYQF